MDISPDLLITHATLLLTALYLVVAGFRIVKSKGNAGKLKDARKHLLHVLIGTALFMSSWLLGTALVNTLNVVIPGLFNGVTLPAC